MSTSRPRSTRRSTEALAKVGPKRRRMPRERQSITHKFSIGGHEGYITAGMYEDGTIGEIFLTDIGKEGSTLRGMMNSFATAISLSLQYGVPLETLVRKFSYMRFEPEGMTTNPEIPFSKSMPDYIMRWLASRFLDADLQEELGILTKEVRARKAAQDAASSHLGDTAGPVASRSPAQSGRLGADRRPAGAAGGPPRPRSRAGLPAVRRHDAADRQLLHVRELRVQHRLRLIGRRQFGATTETITLFPPGTHPGREQRISMSGAPRRGVLARFSALDTNPALG